MIEIYSHLAFAVSYWGIAYWCEWLIIFIACIGGMVLLRKKIKARLTTVQQIAIYTIVLMLGWTIFALPVTRLFLVFNSNYSIFSPTEYFANSSHINPAFVILILGYCLILTGGLLTMYAFKSTEDT